MGGRSKHRLTKVVATLGPASATREVIDELVAAGMDVARINFSHTDQATADQLVRLLQDARAASGRPLAVLGDLQGPKIRIGELDRPLQLVAGRTLRISVAPGHRGPDVVSCDYPDLPRDLRPGAPIFLRDGTIELEVSATGDDWVDATVRMGGELTSRAGVNLPGIDLRLPALTPRDLDDIAFASRAGFDYLALSFVRRAADLEQAREQLRRHGAETGLIAKIEHRLALDDLDAIAEASDGVMVARGDLGVEVGPDQVPLWQRRIIAAARGRLVPSIVATEMLESMRERTRPTRAEASDVAHAVWEGADALMLSAESAIGRFPVQSVRMMDSIIQRAESLRLPLEHDDEREGQKGDSAGSIARAVREVLARDRAVAGIVAFTITGYSARRIAAARTGVRVLALGPDPRVQRQLVLVHGVEPVLCEAVDAESRMLAQVDAQARALLGSRPGETVVVVGAMPIGRGGETNFMALHRVGEAERESAS